MKLFGKRKPVYYCKYCGRKHSTFYMAQLCFDLDMKILQRNESQGKDKNVHKK